MPYLSPYHRPVPNSAKFRENIEILRKWANSMAWLKLPCAMENCGPYPLLGIFQAVIMVVFIIKDAINPSETLRVHNQIQICSDTWRMWCKRSSSQFQMANHRIWGIVGYSDVTVCVTVIKSLTKGFFFIGIDRSRLTNLAKSTSIGLLIMNTTINWVSYRVSSLWYLPVHPVPYDSICH